MSINKTTTAKCNAKGCDNQVAVDSENEPCILCYECIQKMGKTKKRTSKKRR